MNKRIVLVLLVLLIASSVCLAVILKPAKNAKLTDNTVLGRPNPFAQAMANLTGKPYFNKALSSEPVYPDYWVVTYGGK